MVPLFRELALVMCSDTSTNIQRPPRRGGRRIGFAVALMAAVTFATLAAVVIGELLAARRADQNPAWARARAILAGEAEGEDRYFHDPGQYVIGQPYLLYSPAPGLSEMDHNEAGYRGPMVPVPRTRGAIRILFIGGSTVYGWGVRSATETYPLQLGTMLEGKLPQGVSSAEIINAGLPFGTSAEHLTHYLFKFRYYHPDIVVLESGGNDAGVERHPHYQPDYSHWRKEMSCLRPLPPRYRFLMRSNLASAFIINCVQPDFVHQEGFIRPNPDDPPLTPWFCGHRKDLYQQYGYPDAFSAYHNNTLSLIREVREDGATLIVVPFHANPHAPEGEGYAAPARISMDRNRDTLSRLARESGGTIADIEPMRIPPGGWADPWCHLNAEGERMKAEMLLAAIGKVVSETSPHSDPPIYPLRGAYPGSDPDFVPAR